MKIRVPRWIETGVRKKRKRYLSMNNYRNWHPHVSNDVKKRFKEAISNSISGIILDPPIRITITYYNPTKRLSDLDGMCGVVQKFVQDAFVELGCLPDDNYKYITEIMYKYGGYVKNIDYLDVEVTSI